MDPHLPRRLRAHPAPGGAAPRLQDELHDLRPGRPGPARQDRARGARARHEALRPARDPRADLEREEPADHAGRLPRARRLVLRPDGGRRLRPLPAAAARLERGRLRRHADADGPGARALPRGAREVAEGVPLHPRRRVPGHEPRAVPAPAAAGPEAPEPVRRRRSGPVDLRLSRRRPPQHHGVRARLPRHEDDRARAELPLDERDPRGRERGHLEQPRTQAEEPLVRPRDRRPGARRRARGRACRGALRRGRDRGARRGGLQRRRDRGLLPDERAVARARRRARAPGDRVPGDRRAALLRARGGEGPHLVPPGARQPVRHGRACCGSRTSRAAGSASRPSRGCRTTRAAAGSRSGRRWSSRRRPGSRRSRPRR